ncbi:MAG: S-layer homology domain-containing protein [Oscillibacter sp.]|nr:S-layer homology domain-containing protein [Oscillibacter sp.]
MKKLTTALLALMLLAVLAIPAAAADTPSFTYQLVLTDRRGNTVNDLRQLSAGDRVEVEILLSRTDTDGAYTAYGVEFRTSSNGLTYNGDGTFFYSGSPIVARQFTSGLAVGAAYFDLSRTGMEIANPLSVCKWSFTVDDPEAAELYVATALVYVPEHDGGHQPVGNARLTLDANGGAIAGRDVSGAYDSGTQVTLPGARRSGYTFLGWSDGTATYETGARYTVTGAVTLTARWEKITTSGGSGGTTAQRTVSLALKGGTLTGADVSGAYPSGTVITLPDAARSGYTFAGWSDGKEIYRPGARYTVSGSVTLSAQWMSDIPESFNAADHIAYIRGFTDGTVRPNANITRAQAATMLYRLLNVDLRDDIFTVTNTFGDVDRGAWYNKAVSSMANGGYIGGYSDGTFGGDRYITRAQFVAILMRAVGDRTGTASFTDVPASHWAARYIAAAADAGWIGGYSDGSFRPDQYITRAQVAAILNRMLHRGVNGESTLTAVRSFPDNQPGAWYYYEIVEASTVHDHTGSRPNEDWTGGEIGYVYDIEKYERP